MKYTLTKRDIGILFGFFGIVILGLTYYFIYMGYSGKTKELEAANTAMQARVDVLQELVNRQAELVENTDKFNREAEELMDRFPADYRYEDAILYGIELVESSPMEDMPSIAFGEEQTIYTFADIDAVANEQVKGYIPEITAAAPEAAAEEAAPEVPAAPAPEAAAVLPELKSKTITYTNKTDYGGFKNALASVINKPDRCGLNVTAVYDANDGLITDTLSVISYYVVNTDKVYKEPEMPVVIKGTDDIFNTNAIRSSSANGRLNMGSSGIVNGENTGN